MCLCRRVGVLSAAVSLATHLGDEDTAQALFDTALTYWKNFSSVHTYSHLVIEAARYKLAHNFPVEAAKLLQELHSLSPNDMKVSTHVNNISYE